MSEKKKRKSIKLNRLYFITMSLVLVVLAASIFVFRLYMSGFSKSNTEQHLYDRYYVMITDDPKSSFWQSIYKGANENAQKNNVFVELLGESLSQNYSCAEQMEIAISSEVDGIMVYADESEEMKNLINSAVKGGIPVVTLYSDNTLSQRCSFVGIGGYNLGREYGRQVLKMINEGSENFKDSEKLNISVMTDVNRDDAQIGVIVSGMQDTFSQEGNGTAEFEISFATVDNTNAFSAEESIRDIFSGQDVPDVLVCLNELDTTCAYQAVVDYNMVGDVNILGYYDSDTILNAIDHGVLYATASIDTYQMGQFSVDALEEFNEMGYTSQYFTANVTVIDSSNVSEYLEKGDGDIE